MRRLTAFDGLRGVSALIVVIHHCLLTFPTLSGAFLPEPGEPTPTGLSWWLLYTPLHLLWAGTEAVFVFFILSGYVLAVPALNRERFSWRAYYPSRLLRLYLPIVASVVLALFWFVVVPRTRAGANSSWELIHAVPSSATSVLTDMFVLAGADPLNSPLWSLRWEMIFSLLLPAYLAVALVTRRIWWLVLLVLIPLGMVAASLGVGFVLYLALFAIGTVLAVSETSVSALFARLGRLGSWTYPALFVVGLLGITVGWYTLPLRSDDWTRASSVISVLSVTVVVLMARYWDPLKTVLSTWLPQELGRLSFSLYLVHEPIVVSIAYLLPPRLNWLVLPLGLTASLLAAILFFKVVEAPAHRLSQHVKRTLARRPSTAPALPSGDLTVDRQHG